MAAGRVIDNGGEEREKGNGGVPGCRSPGSSLDLHGCGWSSLSPGSVPDSRVPLPRVGTRIYYSAACFTSGAETMVKTRVETGRSAYVRGPLLLVDLPPLPLASFLSSTPSRRLEGGVDARVRWSIFVACVMAGNRYRLVSFPEGFFFEKGERKLGCAIIDLQHESGIFFRKRRDLGEIWERRRSVSMWNFLMDRRRGREILSHLLV